MNTEGLKIKPKIKAQFPQDYELEWGKDIPPCVLTHLVRVCDLLSGYVDQESVSIGKLAYKLAHHPDMQDAVISIMFQLRQEDASRIRLKLIRDKKLDHAA